MSELLFYEKLVALNRARHQNLRLKPMEDGYAFSGGVNSVPLAGIEFFEASRDMTVLFQKGADGHFFPVVMMSLSNSGHELVDARGNWQGSYVPAFIRRYPFALAADGTVCLDENSRAFSETEGNRCSRKVAMLRRWTRCWPFCVCSTPRCGARMISAKAWLRRDCWRLSRSKSGPGTVAPPCACKACTPSTPRSFPNCVGTRWNSGSPRVGWPGFTLTCIPSGRWVGCPRTKR